VDAVDAVGALKFLVGAVIGHVGRGRRTILWI